MTSSAACSVAVLVIEPANMPSVWPILMPNACPNASATTRPAMTATNARTLALIPAAPAIPSKN